MLKKTYFINSFKNFFKYLLSVVLVFCLIIMLFDIIELLRLASKYQIMFWQIIKLSLMKNYASYSRSLPIIILISSLLFYRHQHNNNELIAAQSLGINIFQITMPCIIVTLLFGVFNILVVNPIGTTLVKKYHDYSANEFQYRTPIKYINKSGIWLKNKLNEQTILINAQRISKNNNTLYGIDIFILNNDGSFERSIIADQIESTNHNIVLKNYSSIDKNSNIIKGKETDLPIHISVPHIYDNISTIDTISFYRFLKFIKVSKESGLSTDRHILNFIQYITLPFFLVSMIFISFYFCDKFKDNYMTYIICLTVGFIIFFSSNFIYSLGYSGKISILISALFPILAFNALGIFLVLNKT